MTQKKIGELLEKYFDAGTSKKEEAHIRKYFASGDIAPEHLPYSAMFNSFSSEISELDLIKTEAVHSTSAVKAMFSGRARQIRLFATVGTAALLIIGAFIFAPSRKESVMIIDGIKVKNDELALAKTVENINRLSVLTAKLQENVLQMERMNKMSDALASLEEFNKLLSQSGQVNRLY